MGLGWILLAMAPVGPLGVAIFALNLMLFGLGAVLMFINFLALRQSVTPAPMLGRMTSTMRWLILCPAAPGALIGGYVGQHLGLRVAVGGAGAAALLLALTASRIRVIRSVKTLPTLKAEAITPYAAEEIAADLGAS